MKAPLWISERLLLLALHEKKGRVLHSSSVALPHGLAGAVLFDLLARNCIAIEDKKVTAIDGRSAGEPMLDEALDRIRTSRRVRSLDYWVARPNVLSQGLLKQLLERLAERGIVRRERRHFLGLIPYTRYPQHDGMAKGRILERIRAAVLHGEKADEPTALLIALLSACELHRAVFPDRKRREVKAQLRRFTENECVSGAVAARVAAVTAAVVVSAATASAAAASASG